MKKATLILLLISLSGFWVTLSESWTAIYKANLLFHPIIGIFGLLWFFWRRDAAIVRRSDKQSFKMAFLSGTLLTEAFGLLQSVYPLFLWTWLLIGIYPIWTLFIRRESFIRRCMIFYFAAAAASGFVFFAVLGGRDLIGFLVMHRASSIALVIALAVKGLASFSKATMTEGLTWNYFRITAKNSAYAIVPTVLLIAVAALDTVKRAPEPYYRFHLSTYTLERRGPNEQDILPENFNEPGLASKTFSCGGTSGCHQPLVDDMLASSHGRSMHTKYIQKNMALLSEEVGAQNQITCGGCHYPRMMFDRSKSLHEAYKEPDYSCTFCHLIDGVRLWEDPRKTDLAVLLHVPHLRMFDRDGRDEISSRNRLLINLNPYGHKRVFTKSLYFKDEYCLVCHRLQIKATPDTPMAKPRCIDCHMQPRHLLGKEGTQRNHLFPGMNTAIANQVGDQNFVSMNQLYARGELPLPISGWGSFWEPRNRKSGKMVWIHQKAIALTEPHAGQEFTMRILTINASIDHIFPAGPLDLIEAWQKVTVRDQDGNILLGVGDLDSRYRVDPAAHRLGGYMMGEDGKVVERNRVWQIKEKVVRRGIPFHHSTMDDYSFHLPAGVTSLNIEAYWLYRKLEQDFVDWACGEGKETVPLIVASELKAVIHVR